MSKPLTWMDPPEVWNDPEQARALIGRELLSLRAALLWDTHYSMRPVKFIETAKAALESVENILNGTVLTNDEYYQATKHF